MEHSFDSAWPPSRLIRVYADEVPSFADELPAVAEVVELEASHEGAVLHRVHRWSADVSRFPRVLTRMLPPSYFQWTTDCHWDEERYQGTWTLNIGVFGEGAHITGAHRFLPRGEGTRTEVSGEVLIDTGRYPTLAGVPVGRTLQRVLDGLIRRVFAEVVARSGSVIEAHLEGSRGSRGSHGA